MIKQLTITGLSCAAALLTAVSPAGAQSRLSGADFYVHNRTGAVLTVMTVTPVSQEYIESADYIHPTGAPNSDIDLQPYSSEKVFMHGDSCYYNVVGHFDDGSTRWKNGVDLCHVSDFNFNP